ncbi:DEAD/DEAH box helicase [Aspergillus homomorphus CBS 101889]|uniref:Helicase C-terminal domain-containing protein n=1 Tax=Aspergillus homomorphus (strain CBS 101889) TaxID=1450537 RepID=A0A395HPN2_ASPHC|nr:hypothetical protein BO97DRAFT_445219 [Aspergillus homomorphus CBS 101889]RAL09710.1 hypothetical protein BO97DRAFT_445219 [Aspergillus homomorphus CBS 101889]
MLTVSERVNVTSAPVTHTHVQKNLTMQSLPTSSSPLGMEYDSMAIDHANDQGEALSATEELLYPSLESSVDSPASTPTPATPRSECPAPRSIAAIDTPVVASGVLHQDADLALDSYIGVGVLRKPNLIYGGADEVAAAPAPAVGADGYPASEVINLESHQWIRTISFTYQEEHASWCGVRVYVLPDDVGRKVIPRSNGTLRRALKVVMERVDRSDEAWMGEFVADWSTCGPTTKGGGSGGENEREEESLWYIFNTLQDPAPRADVMKNPYARRAMEQLLTVVAASPPPLGVECEDSGPDYSGVLGLKTPLYPYQRRSAATMVQREAQPAQMLDPRLEARTSPTGQEYYYDKEEGRILREKRMYSEACGGILAETMGCGKTLISLAVILATRGHFPEIPLEYQELGNPVRNSTGSLVEMAAAAAGRFSLPWKSHFDELGHYGTSYIRCVEACERNRGAYTIPPPPARHGGRSGVPYPRPSPQKVRLSSGTLIVAPPNLVNHWQKEIETHTQGLKVLTLRNNSDQIPSPDELLQYDILLFSKVRFEKEAGEPAHLTRHLSEPPTSPLTRIYWLRIIVDEGHNAAGSAHRSNMAHILRQLHIERRWIVSGTPSSGLYGVEVSLASQETHTSDTDLTEATTAVLKGRKKTGNAWDSELKDMDKLRRIVIDFLELKPWSNSRNRTDDQANWVTYMTPVGSNNRRRKAPSLRATLQSLVVRHRLDVIHNEITLPRLFNRVVHLEPTFYDRMSLNYFIFILAVNAITSERKDQDYMFHPRNRKHLSLLISNLRQAGFWWAGSDGDLSSTIENASKYLEKNRDSMAEDDISLIEEGIQIAGQAQTCSSWHAFKQMHELGVYLEDFPSHARSMWALDKSSTEAEPLLLGITQAHHAQRFVTKQLNMPDPADGLAGAGIRARRELTLVGNEGDNFEVKKTTPDKPIKSKSPKKTYSKGLVKTLSPESPLAQTKLVATASAKLTYLLDQISAYHKDEKIIVFYENPNTAYWIAEGIELLGIDFRIYAQTLKPDTRAQYLTLFRESEEVRVLLMDLRQASHGLHIANASRVYIVNPIWQPNIESQAIKRAHRIGQTRPVFVETLVLKDTLEDKMLRRRRAMTDSEIQHAERDLLDDSTMSSIIQNERFIPMPENETCSRLAYLQRPAGFFDRHKLAIADDEDVASVEMASSSSAPRTPPAPPKRKRTRLVPVRLSESNSSGPDLVTPKRRRTAAPSVGFMSSQGILMTPPRSSKSPRPTSGVGVGEPANSRRGSPDSGRKRSGKKSVSILGPT